MVVELCTCLLCIHFDSLLAFPFRNDFFRLSLALFKFNWMCVFVCKCIKIVACTIYEHKPNAKWYFETLSKNRETPVQRKRRRRSGRQNHERRRKRKREGHMNCSNVVFLLIHALISSLVCHCCDCFLGLFVELLVTHLSLLLARYGDLPYLFIHFLLLLVCCSLALNLF